MTEAFSCKEEIRRRVHPSNIGHALLANEFIRMINQSFNMNVSLRDDNVLKVLFLLDLSIDKERDGKASGRLGVGLVETLMFLFKDNRRRE